MDQETEQDEAQEAVWPSTGSAENIPSNSDPDLTARLPILYQPADYSSQCECRCPFHRVCPHEVGPSTSKDGAKDDANYEIEWTWDTSLNSENTELSKSNLEVTFHKHFSNGTAAIRGSSPLQDDQHYWEIKMTTSVYGTDMMVGFGTELVNLQGSANKFISFLGADAESWGLSYTGNLVHNGVRRKVCRSFGHGVTIGIHLDMWLGKMSVFRNGKFVGVGFSKGIRGKVIYPMACSTAARTGMKIVRSCSFPTSLQFMCCQVLRSALPADKDVSEAIFIAPGLKMFLANNLDWLLRPHLPHNIGETISKIRKRSHRCSQSAFCEERKKLRMEKNRNVARDDDDAGTSL